MSIVSYCMSRSARMQYTFGRPISAALAHSPERCRDGHEVRARQLHCAVADWLPKRWGMAAGAVAAALLLALVLLRRDSGPTWVASAVPTQVALACCGPVCVL